MSGTALATRDAAIKSIVRIGALVWTATIIVEMMA